MASSRAGEFAIKAAKIGAVIGALFLVGILLAAAFSPPGIMVATATGLHAITAGQLAVTSFTAAVIGAVGGGVGFGALGGITGLFFRNKDHCPAPKNEQAPQNARTQEPELANSQAPQVAQEQTQAQPITLSEAPQSTYFRDSVNNSRQVANTGPQL